MVDAVGKRVTVLVDSGFRRGSDVVEGACHWARTRCMVGRSTLYGVAAGGEEGARRAIDLFRDEIDRVMALLGCTSVAELSTEHLHATDLPVRAAEPVRPGLKLLDTARAAER